MNKLLSLLIASIFASVSVAAIAAEDIGSKAEAKHDAKKGASHKVNHIAKKKAKHKARHAMAKDSRKGMMH